MINEKGLCKLLKSAFKTSGYELVPQSISKETEAGNWRRNTLTINGKTWAVQCQTVDLPPKASVQVVEDAGYLPVEAIQIQRGAPNQLIIQDAISQRIDFFRAESGEIIGMKKIPVIFKDRWQLYQTEQGAVYGFDTELLQLIDWKQYTPDCYISASGRIGVFIWLDTIIYITTGRFSREDGEKIVHIAALDWEGQLEHDDPAVNISLFDPQEDVPTTEPEE
jgi:hypothetical protein